MTTPIASVAQLETADAIREFVLAGDARFTLVSRKSGERRTFRVRLAPNPKPAGPWFVSMLTGPDNEADYRYLGALWQDDVGLRFVPQAKPGMEVAKQIARWFVRSLDDAPALLVACEFWHAGRCGKCGRVLTTPESVARGIGPICSEREPGLPLAA